MLIIAYARCATGCDVHGGLATGCDVDAGFSDGGCALYGQLADAAGVAGGWRRGAVAATPSGDRQAHACVWRDADDGGVAADAAAAAAHGCGGAP